MNSTSTARYSATLPVSRQSAFDYHSRAGALRRLLPPWQKVEIESTDDSLDVGSRVVMRMRVAGVPIRWVAEHTRYEPPSRFDDVQVEGPFAEWHHRHSFEAIHEDRCELTDSVTYRIPGGAPARWLGASWVRRQLDQMFAYRHATTAADLRLARECPLNPLKIGVSGSHGLIGSHLCPLLSVLGHEVLPIVRGSATPPNEPERGIGPAGAPIAAWAEDPPSARLRQLDAVIHLAGKSIADERWSDDVKQQILDSRVRKTRELCERLAKLGSDAPRTLLCASATGIYGDRGDEPLTEASPEGEGFLADVARQWEEAARPARDAGIRVVYLRFGVILSPRGGALAKLLPPVRAGLGGTMGRGDQWWSWISIDDCLGAIYHALATDSLHGPVNVVAPEPLRNREFSKTLGRVLNRPAVLPVPAAALRGALGEMAGPLLLASARVLPERLEESGYAFRFPSLQPALAHLLGRRTNVS